MIKRVVILLLVALSFSGLYNCAKAEENAPSKKFKRLFCWGGIKDEETARKFSEIGVTDITVNNKKQFDLAVKYGMKPYTSTFGPRGKNWQVMSPEEEKHFAYINGHDLKNEDRSKIIDKRELKRSTALEENLKRSLILLIVTASVALPATLTMNSLKSLWTGSVQRSTGPKVYFLIISAILILKAVIANTA